MGAIKAPYTVTIEITEDADGWHLPNSEEYERRRMAREFIVKEYQTFPYKGAMHEMPELIRCRNCRFFKERYLSVAGNKVPAHWCEEWYGNTPESGFCHLAERKDE